MLKAIQNLGCSSSGWLLWKTRTSSSGGFSFISVSTRPFSYSSSSTRAARTTNCSFSACKTPSFRRFRARSESSPDAASASSSSPVALQSSSSVSFISCYLLSLYLMGSIGVFELNWWVIT